MAQIKIYEPSEYFNTLKQGDVDTGEGSLPEAPLKIRFLVEGAPNRESKLATLKKFYTDVQEIEDGNYILTDAKGKKHIFDDREKTNFADFIDASKEITEALASTAGAIGGSMIAPGAGTIVGSGAGMAAGAEAFERVAQMFGTEILRTPEEYARQRATDVAFGSVGQAVAPMIFKTLKYGITGGKEAIAKAGQRLEAFVNAGVEPSLGQVTTNRGIQTIELALGNIPGSSGKIAQFAQKAQDDFGKSVVNLSKKILAGEGATLDDIAKQAIPDETIAGQVIQKGISDKGMLNGVNSMDSWTGRFKSVTGLLFNKVDEYVPPKSLFNISNTQNMLLDLNKPIAGAPTVTKLLENPFIADVFEGVLKDSSKLATRDGVGRLSYEALKTMRSRIGDRLSDATLIGNTEKGQLKQLYAALTRDIEAGVLNTGGPKAVNALQRANATYEKGLQKLDDFLQPIYNKADPDNIVKSLMGSSAEGATRIAAVKSSLTAPQYKVLLSTILDKMGRISAGQGLAEGVEQTGRFSTEVFLTNWNKLSPAAKKVLFNGKGFGPGMIKDLDALTKVSSIIRESGKTFKNPSGTADRLAGVGLVIGGGAGVVTGNPMFLAALPMVMGAANLTARLMTNPKFVKWAAEATKIAGNKGYQGIAEHLTKLGVIAANSSPEERQYLYEYMDTIAKSGNANAALVTEEDKMSIRPTRGGGEKITTEQQINVPTLDRSILPGASTGASMAPGAMPTAQGAGGIASLAANPQTYQALFPGDTLGAVIAGRR